ncbi:hypothetical protein KUTeg_002224 [Tegillarca granosa]|uniref:Poly [ADP-ribose] polymerase n=1 Tax=Tegillarca granosa TaxID=220873 RepID=A0ABQ9FXA8_TEGGR|nr:hypothetical protein KUTeg_002224 [Tegillarca granosa]
MYPELLYTQHQYPYSPMQVQGHNQSDLQKYNQNPGPGFPQYPLQGGPMFYVDQRYYNSVAQRVLAHGNHKIDDIELEVKQYIPPKPRQMYENKIFITGMNPETTTDCLSNFLEAKTSTSPLEIIYGEEEGTALVTFEEKPDIQKLIMACKKRALEKHFLSVSRVPVTNCIKVSGLKDTTSKDTIEFYFENTKRSGGGDIEKIEMKKDDNTCLVYFSDVSESVEVKKYISTILRQATVNTVWDIDAQQNVIMYSLSDDEGVKGAHILKDAIVETPISLKEEALFLLQSQKWQKAKWEIENRAPGLIKIMAEVNKNQILIYTMFKFAGEVREKMEDFLHENTIYEKQMSSPSGKMRFLLQYQKVNIDKIAKELKEHQVSIIMDSVKIRIKGTDQGLKQAMAKIDDIAEMVKQKTHLIKKLSLAKYLLTDAGQESIKRVEKAKMCVIESEPCYSSCSQDNETEVIEKIDKSDYQDLALCVTSDGQRIIARKGDITELDVDVLVNAANSDLQHDGGLAKAIVQKGGMSIQDECNDFIRRNHDSLYEGEIYCSAPGNLKCKVIAHAVGPIWKGGNQNEDELLREAVFKSLEESEERGHKSIAIPALCSGVFGYPVSQATKVITESVRDFFRDYQPVYIKDVFLCDVNEVNVEQFAKGLIEAFGKENVQIQKRVKSLSAWTTPSDKKGAGLSSNSSSESTKPHTKFCKINIRIVKGQIARQKVDVIVNTTEKDLNLKVGAVSSTLLKIGGKSLQDECSAKYPNGIIPGEIAETSGGSLQCSKVLHGSLPNWDDGGKALDVLRTFMKNCLIKTDQSGLASVAFPALGTGNLNFPKDVVAKEMFQCVIDFSSNQPSSSVTEVKFVLYDKDFQTVQAFEDEERRRQSEAEGGEIGSHNTRKGRKFSTELSLEQKQHDRLSNKAHGGHGSHGNQQGTHNGGQIAVGKLQLKVYQGDITKARADVIVNSTNSEFDLTKEDKTKAWKDKITKILEKSDKLNVKSVAFPALGTGLGTKIEDVADSLFDAMIEFQNSSFQSLKEVHMVIFQSQMMNSFIDQIKTCVNTKGKKSRGIIATIGSWLGFTSDDKTNETQTVEKRKEGGYTPDKQLQNVQEPVCVKLKIYANDKKTLDSAKEMIEDECENLKKTKVFEEKIIKEFSKEQEQSVFEICKAYGVEVKLEKRIGRLRLTGFVQDISCAYDNVIEIIRQAEKEKQTKQQANLYAEFVKWYFIEETEDGSQLEEYPNSINLKLEIAYKNQEKDVRFCDVEGREYTVDLNKLIEYPTDNPKDQVTVVRKDLVKDESFEPPATWKSMQDSENLMVEDLSPWSSEFQTVIKNFQQQAGQVNIVKCQRIQNLALYRQYVAKKKSIDAENPPTVVNEKMLWHSTAGKDVDSINAYGFNRSSSDSQVKTYGNGVHFAVNASKSFDTNHPLPDPGTGHRHIYQCKVLTGEFAQGQQGMKVPPNKPSTSGAASHILYDSVVDNVNSPGIFVIFNDTQAYPEYHIIFR